MRSICLIGYRGVGKSTVARALANLLQRPWIDADVALEQEAGKTIREIFSEHGEAAFRELEMRILRRLLQGPTAVLALGGGVVLREQNRQQLAGHPTVWLRAEADLIFRRLKADSTTTQRRPALTDHNEYEEIVALLAEREPLYREAANYIVETSGKTPEQIAREIVSLLEPKANSTDTTETP